VLRVAEQIDTGAYGALAASGRVDGFLLCDVEVDDRRFDLLADGGVPAVVAGHPVSPCPFPWVETAHADGMRLVAEHLLERGHRRIGFVGGSADLEHVQARLGVWRETLEAAAVEPGPVAHTAGELFGGQVTAIVHTSDGLAAAALGAARERGIDVPGDLAITGFDDSPLAALSAPPLTSVRVDYAGFGEGAAAALLASIAGEPLPVFEPASPELVVRDSTAAP
jgi:DNA-binding LacI/PurR family transcriptional regulator